MERESNMTRDKKRHFNREKEKNNTRQTVTETIQVACTGIQKQPMRNDKNLPV